MKKTSVLAFVFTAAAITFAQGPRGPLYPNSSDRPASAIDMTKVRPITGAVSALNVAYGTRYP